jgi:anhydro-N-acetylmuramic acid kinase
LVLSGEDTDLSMEILERIARKRSKLVVGLISGTSVDGIDAALVRIDGAGTATRARLVAFDTYSLPEGLKELVLANSLPGSGSVDLICRLNILFGQLFAGAAKRIARKARVHFRSIDLIGSHGQTVHHLPKPHRMFGQTVRATLQIGDPSTIAQLTGVVTVGDFRTADMAVGGQGAPLVPYLDYLLCRSSTKNRILLNLGGIANVTALPKSCRPRDVIAFDTGPANMLIDAFMRRLFEKPYDRDGSTALRGDVVPGLISWMISHPYFKRRPPKSTGREEFGEMVVRELLKRARGVENVDVITTVTEFTALSVFDQYNRFIRKRMKVDELLVSGGGSHNRAIMQALGHYFAPARVMSVEEVGISSDAKEAVLFAVLANETIAGNPSNIPSVTGARRPAILGKICLP